MFSNFSFSRFFTTKMSKISIGTHDGCFHCDEALACFMLKQLPEYSNAEIVRSRDMKVLQTCDIVVDVGAVYDPSKHRYDHHQESFKESMKSLRPNLTSDIRLSSAGLVYHHFGERILETVYGSKVEPKILTKLFTYVYEDLIKEVDAIDNGIPMYEVGEPRYNITTSLSARVGQLHPPWNGDSNGCTLELFEKAMALTGAEFLQRVHHFRDVWWPARSLVEAAIDKRFESHESGAIIEIPGCPWRQHLFDVEREQGIEGSLKYVIFKDGSWRVAAVPVVPGSFVLRTPLLEAWRGLRNEELIAASGVPGAVFVHSSGFIGGADSREGAITLAVKSLEGSPNGS